MNSKAFSRIWLGILVSLVLVTLNSGQLHAQDTSLPNRIPLTQKQIPLDVKVAVMGIMNHLRGGENPARLVVRLAKADKSQKIIGFPYKGFRTIGYDLLSYAKGQKDPSFRKARVLVYLNGPLGRRAALDCEAVYSFNEKTGLTISAYKAEPIINGNPRVEIMVVPAELLPPSKELAKLQPSWEGLYLLARRLDLGKLKTLPQRLEKKEFLVFAFLMDQTLPDQKVTLLLADLKKDDPTYGSDDLSRTIDSRGWRVAMAGGRLLIRPGKPLFLKLVRQKGEGEQATREIIHHQDLKELWEAAK